MDAKRIEEIRRYIMREVEAPANQRLMTELVDELEAKEQARAQWAETAARKGNENSVLRAALAQIEAAVTRAAPRRDRFIAQEAAEILVSEIRTAIAAASAALTASTERAESDPPTTKENSK